MAFLELKHVSKSYGSSATRTAVLQDINLAVEKGEFVAIVGYSGAGKTTLINLIAGLFAPDEGSLTLNDVEITGPGPDRGIVFQNYSLLPWLTVYENILLAVEQVFPNAATAKKREQAEKFIAMVNLTPAREKRPGELSGGMRQRVSVARALAMDPQVLLLDEPLSALDALTRATLQEEISRLCQESGKTIVLITNDPDEAILLADRIIPLSAGPGASLGPEIHVTIARPRDRKAINHDPRFKEIRRRIVDWLLGEGGRKRVTVSRKLTLPDVEPEDLSAPRPMWAGRPRARRHREEKRETVAMNL
ncbi:MAG: ABC transporter ATP-binding protein [Verrucomicrobia bacterium]|nr:ABC transporter ATP-binding protein [Verrucomicrobiota bacterium]